MAGSFRRGIFAALLAALAASAVPARAAGDWLSNLADNPAAPGTAPRGWDVSVVEFFDYACPYCKAMHPTLKRFLAADGHVRLVYRDWPVLGPVSVEAARDAIAAQWQGRHDAFHDALLESRGHLDEAGIRAAATRAGIDWPRLERDKAAHAAEIAALLGETMRGAQRMGLNGTPTVLIGNHLLAGALTDAQLRQAVATARAEKTRVAAR